VQSKHLNDHHTVSSQQRLDRSHAYAHFAESERVATHTEILEQQDRGLLLEARAGAEIDAWASIREAHLGQETMEQRTAVRAQQSLEHAAHMRHDAWKHKHTASRRRTAALLRLTNDQHHTADTRHRREHRQLLLSDAMARDALV